MPNPAPDADLHGSERRLGVWGHPPAAPRCHQIACQVMLDLMNHAALFPQTEVGGVLIGSLPEKSGTGTVVVDLIPALASEASRTHVTFTHDSWQAINESLDARTDQAQIVGWYHTHPGFGPFYSAHDTFIHEQFFLHPAHLGLVVDPLQRSLTAFGWARGRLKGLPGVVLLAGEATDSPTEIAQGLALLKQLTYVETSPSRMALLKHHWQAWRSRWGRKNRGGDSDGL